MTGRVRLGLVLGLVALVLSAYAVSGRLTQSGRVTTYNTGAPTVTVQHRGSAGLAAAAEKASKALNVVVLGDSVPAGNACDCTSFPDLVAQELGTAQHRDVTVDNLALGGSTSQYALSQLTDEANRAAIANADLVMIETGANDFSASDAADPACQDVTSCYAGQLKLTTKTISEIVKTVKGLQTRNDAQVSVIGYWNVFADGQVAKGQGDDYLATSDSLTRELNAAIAQIAAENHVSSPNVYTPFKGIDGSHDPTPYLAEDGDHPNAAGHQLLAHAVVTALHP